MEYNQYYNYSTGYQDYYQQSADKAYHLKVRAFSEIVGGASLKEPIVLANEFRKPVREKCSSNQTVESHVIHEMLVVTQQLI